MNKFEEIKMDREIKIWKNRLEISKVEGSTYTIKDRGADLFIHVHSFKLNSPTNGKTWLSFYGRNDTYIGCLWISTDTDMKKLQQFLEDTK